MKLWSDSYWGAWADVVILQTYEDSRTNTKKTDAIQMNVQQAKQLIEEINKAITFAENMDAEYNAHMLEEEKRNAGRGAECVDPLEL